MFCMKFTHWLLFRKILSWKLSERKLFANKTRS
jgi:hypothetical protein